MCLAIPPVAAWRAVIVRAIALSIEIHHEENGSLWATVPSMPGVFATGDTMDELRESLQEGISLWLAKPGQDAPPVDLGELEKKQTLASATFAHA